MQNTDSLLGLNIQPDGWKFNFEPLTESDGFSDSSFAGCQYRLACKNYKLAVNVKITGRKSHDISTANHPWYKTRVQIEFVGDGEPSEFDGAWIFSPNPLIN